jgi:hypothetical protein
MLCGTRRDPDSVQGTVTLWVVLWRMRGRAQLDDNKAEHTRYSHSLGETLTSACHSHDNCLLVAVAGSLDWAKQQAEALRKLDIKAYEDDRFRLPMDVILGAAGQQAAAAQAADAGDAMQIDGDPAAVVAAAEAAAAAAAKPGRKRKKAGGAAAAAAAVPEAGEAAAAAPAAKKRRGNKQVLLDEDMEESKEPAAVKPEPAVKKEEQDGELGEGGEGWGVGQRILCVVSVLTATELRWCFVHSLPFEWLVVMKCRHNSSVMRMLQNLICIPPPPPAAAAAAASCCFHCSAPAASPVARQHRGVQQAVPAPGDTRLYQCAASLPAAAAACRSYCCQCSLPVYPATYLSIAL